jgi:hypothetical protein
MIAGTTGDLNEAEFVSRDVARPVKKLIRSGGWISHTMRQWDGWELELR